MRYAVLILAALPAMAQIAARQTPAAAVPKSGSAPIVSRGPLAKIPLSALAQLERAFDSKLAALGSRNDPVDLLGATRGLYLDGYGVVFTTELSLVVTPAIMPFRLTISDATKAQVHSAKVSRLPLLRKAIAEAAAEIATSMGQVPENQQVVVAVRLAYASWENTSGLPGLIVAKGDRRSAVAGQVKLEEQ